MRVVQGIAAGLAGVAAAVVVACGVDTADSGKPNVPEPEGSTATTPVRRSTVPLPPAPENTVRVDGLRGGLSSVATSRFLSRSNVEVAFIRAEEDQAFTDLCAGRVDVVEVARLPSDAELQACRERGVAISEPLQVGADAIVVATKNEADVGGDCITVNQARDIFRAGSPYSSWSQLGFFDLPLTATGREDGSPNFELFGQVVLGVPNASLADVRADYVVERTDRLEREEVIGTKRLADARRRIARYVDRLREQSAARREREVDAAVARADRRVLKAIERENRVRARRGDTLTPTEAADIVRRNAQRVARAKAAAADRVNARFDRELRDRGRRFGRGVLAEAQAPGVIGAFRFSYYELFEDQLRPMEIDYGVPVTASGQPVTLDDLDAEDRERLERLTTSTTQTQTVPATDASTTVTTPEGQTTVPTEQAIPELPASQLPDETKDGDPIYPGPNCVFPSQFTITTGAYPLTRRFYVFTSEQSLRRSEVVEYLEAFLNGARDYAIRNRLVPITDAQLAEEIAILHNRGRTPPPQPAPRPTTTTRTVTTPSGTTTVQTVTVPPATTATTPAPASGSGIPGVSERNP
ncbi:MAG TPA: substrate-binding domain-containing protein [Capillimicrobium sp.]|nr:substrate-binding domain-containing protein [Capillimicrobium sp.]